MTAREASHYNGSMAFRHAIDLDRLGRDRMTTVTLDGRRVVLVRIGDLVSAFEDRCVHQATFLSIGKLENRTLTCPVHGWSYDALTGCGRARDAQLCRYAAKVEGDAVLVDVEQVITRPRGPYDDGTSDAE